ncbi:MAG: hypothetical protein IPK16_29590 [Anaerolineales bacterium]|nr:hypothetical protein [Anaerolineales bacterium]
MGDLACYKIVVRDLVSETDLNRLSPIQVVVAQVDPAATRLSVQTDQSGLIGLMRHLHALGFVILAMSRQEIDDTRSVSCHS